jgi:hypothetical protein
MYVSFQCFTHRHLGWKINVVDECDATEAEESRIVESVLPPGELFGEESIQVHSRVKPDNSFISSQKTVKVNEAKTNYTNFSKSSEAPQRPSTPEEYELPVSKVQIKEVIHAVEALESEMKRNATRPLNQYKVYENVDESFLPERPLRDGDEYVVDHGRTPESYFLPPSKQPLTLQTVMRPNPMGKPGPRPPFRRPLPPEIKLRRPPPGYNKGNSAYPLPMPGHSLHMSKKPPMKHPSRMPIGPVRPPPPGVPHKNAMPPPPFSYQKPGFPMKHGPKPPSDVPVSSIVVGKPSNGNPAQATTLKLGQTDIIMNQVVRSQITLPGAGDSATQQSAPQTYLSRPGQIILGKPIEKPQPLDHQMTYTKPNTLHTPQIILSSEPQKTKAQVKIASDRPQPQNEVKSSDFMGEKSVESSTVVTAVNTGFKPDSIVIESGFKPIIREPLMAAEDRITNDNDKSANRREDTDVEEDYDESPQYISHAFPSEKLTQTFEPMFIPSPPDHLVPTEDRTREIFPSNHAKEDRPHPVYVKTEEQLNALFSKNNMEKEVPSDMVMESNKVSPQYLPPDPKLPKEQSQKLSNQRTYTTYDGKTVSADTLTSIVDTKTKAKIFSSKLPASTELLLKTPQFGPFKGEIPPIVGSKLSTEAAKELAPPITDTRATNLKLVNAFKEEEPKLEDLKAEASEQHAVKEDDEDVEEEYDDEDSEVRKRREAPITEFEKGTVEQKKSTSENQMEFEWARSKCSSFLPWSHWLYLVLLGVLSKLV